MIGIQLKLFAHLRDRLPPGAEKGQARLDLPPGTTLEGLLESLGIAPEQASIVVLNGRTTLKLGLPLSDGDSVSVFPPVAGGAPPTAELAESGPQPECLSLDPGTRVKTHVIRCFDASGNVAWERSIYSQYDTRELHATERAVIVGYDDRVVALDPATAELRHDYRIYLFDYFTRLPGDRILAKEKGSCLMLDAAGALIWEHSGQEIMAGLLVHGTHVFLHTWGGAEVDGLKVPYLCLELATGQPDLEGPATAPDFDQLADPEDIAGPRQKVGRAELVENARKLAERRPVVWTLAMYAQVKHLG